MATNEVARVDNISHEEFMEQFYRPGVPVIFNSASKLWKANGIFSPDWFRKNFGDRILKKGNKEYKMSEVFDLVENSTEENPAPYPFIFNIPQKLPELVPMLEPLDLGYATPNWLESKWFQKGYWGSATELFIGGPGGKFPYLHVEYYHMNAWINQLYGNKQFIVFPRGQEKFLYPKPGNRWQSEVDIFNPDFKKHPDFKYATPIKFVLGPGESLFIPFDIWHTAYSLTPTISVAFDQLNQKNFKGFLKDVWAFKSRESKPKAAISYGYAWLAGIACRGRA